MNPNHNQPKTVADTIDQLKKTPASNIKIIVACTIAMIVILNAAQGIKELFFPESNLAPYAESSRESLHQLKQSIEAAEKEAGLR